jgi:hypothetical protein
MSSSPLFPVASLEVSRSPSEYELQLTGLNQDGITTVLG